MVMNSDKSKDTRIVSSADIHTDSQDVPLGYTKDLALMRIREGILVSHVDIVKAQCLATLLDTRLTSEIRQGKACILDLTR